jgi:hypothetical protein
MMAARRKAFQKELQEGAKAQEVDTRAGRFNTGGVYNLLRERATGDARVRKMRNLHL